MRGRNAVMVNGCQPGWQTSLVGCGLPRTCCGLHPGLAKKGVRVAYGHLPWAQSVARSMANICHLCSKGCQLIRLGNQGSGQSFHKFIAAFCKARRGSYKEKASLPQDILLSSAIKLL